jgi:hypothetical protein
MIECYYHWCKYHPKDEPFCLEVGEDGMPKCKASEEQLIEFRELRLKELGWK